MKYFIKLLAVFLSFSSYAQEFSFEFYFEDAVGNRDTLILGYDTLATDSIDPVFGETNMIGTHWDSLFDVRITDHFFRQRDSIRDTATFHTKKQIVNYSCSEWPERNWPFTLTAIDIKAKHWPVTASWNTSPFQDSCINGSILTSIHPGGWWDVGSPSDLGLVALGQQERVSFSSQIRMSSGGHLNDNYAYLSEAGDTISMFWQAFGDSNLLRLDAEENKTATLKIYPNPVSDFLNVQIDNSERIDQLRIFNSFGSLLMVVSKENRIDVSHLPHGMYLVEVVFSNGRRETRRIMKVDQE